MVMSACACLLLPGIGPAVGPVEQAAMTIADALDDAEGGGDVEIAGLADGDPSDMGTGLLAGRDDGPHQVPGGEPVVLLDPGLHCRLPVLVLAGEPVLVVQGALVSAAPG